MLLHFDTLGYKNWASDVRNILSVNGYMYVWEDQGVQNETTFMHAFKKRIKDQFLQHGKLKLVASYSITCIKFQHCLENYLNILKISKFRNALSS